MSSLEERFRAKVGDPNEDGCRPWLGAVDRNGYGRIRVGSRDAEIDYAHRVAYELDVGPIPAGMTIDHVRERGCRLRSCVAPSHLEAVTQAENIRRGLGSIVLLTGRCHRGHLRSEHGYERRDGGFNCRECRRELRAARLAEAA